MKINELKSSINSMINDINNKDFLTGLYNVIKDHKKTDPGIIQKLTDQQLEELYRSIEESEKDENLIDHNEVMQKYEKWL